MVDPGAVGKSHGDVGRDGESRILDLDRHGDRARLDVGGERDLRIGARDDHGRTGVE